MEYILAFVTGLLFGWIASKFIKSYHNIDRAVMIVVSGILFTLSWFVQLPSILMSLTGIFYIGILVFLWFKQKYVFKA